VDEEWKTKEFASIGNACKLEQSIMQKIVGLQSILLFSYYLESWSRI